MRKSSGVRTIIHFCTILSWWKYCGDAVLLVIENRSICMIEGHSLVTLANAIEPNQSSLYSEYLHDKKRYFLLTASACPRTDPQLGVGSKEGFSHKNTVLIVVRILTSQTHSAFARRFVIWLVTILTAQTIPGWQLSKTLSILIDTCCTFAGRSGTRSMTILRA